MFPQVSGNTVILVDKDNLKSTLFSIPQQLLIFGSAGSFFAFAADRFISVYLQHLQTVCGGILPTGSYLGFYTVFCLTVRRIPGINYRIFHLHTSFLTAKAAGMPPRERTRCFLPFLISDIQRAKPLYWASAVIFPSSAALCS